MPKLSCDASNCCYCQDNYCSKSNIRVSGVDALHKGETRCNNFTKKDRTMTNNIYTTEFASFENVNKSVSVECESINCAHNRNKLCCAGSIKIDGHDARKSDETCCDSFRCK